METRVPRPPTTRHRTGPAHLAGVVRRGVLRRRRPLAALLAAVAVLAGARAVAPPSPPSLRVAVAAADLPAGTRLSSADVRVADLPADAVPGGWVGDPQGRTLAGPIAAGEVLTATRLVGEGLSVASGEVVAPVRLTDAAAVDLLAAGDCIDLVAADAATATSRVVGHDLQVLSVPESAATQDASVPGALVVVSVPAASMAAVSAAPLAGLVTFAWCAD